MLPDYKSDKGETLGNFKSVARLTVPESERCIFFLKTYSCGAESGRRKYEDMLVDISNRKRESLEIDLADLEEFCLTIEGYENFPEIVQSNARRYASIFAEAADDIMPRRIFGISDEDDSFDVLMRQRDQIGVEINENINVSPELPDVLRRRFRVYFKPGTKIAVRTVRSIRAADIGHLVTFTGVCTRVGDVKPLLEVACLTCDCCGFEIYQEVIGDNFNPINRCPSGACSLRAPTGELFLETRASKFIKFQEVKVQERSEDVPVGHIPRSLTVQVKGGLTRTMRPGDVVDITGIFLPKPSTGFKARQTGLVADTYIEAMAVKHQKTGYSDILMSADDMTNLWHHHQQQDMYGKLAQSIAPEIYGHADVKKALLLLLCGGVTRELRDGIRIRGDIHVCLMGDPGVAKSQLLKHITTLAPRSVYTTGRGSSGVGLTASIQRDTITGETILEGGALVLADHGICCIDEFDKMEESDRTAIHEVMEQQTVSIAKAGITTTLNARTAVLAAANPAYGRYNIAASPQENINLPAALLSRFDLMWLILDVAGSESDVALAQHVLHVHKEGKPPGLGFEPIASSQLRAYVAHARTFSPHVPVELSNYIASEYAGIRQDEIDAGEKAMGYTTARTLLSILRLSEALARLRWADQVHSISPLLHYLISIYQLQQVSEGDVNEALRLIKMSKISLEDTAGDDTSKFDPITAIYMVREDSTIAEPISFKI
uniref:DNA replication licensing factor MCM7 n=3 Tax=Micromonas pusilla TaxID=38833 RepID=A0A7S0NHS0_MICPS|mmetsp:Transcript_12392/g.52248  ORF Transcript_12392/g.52248 Transcript_12392/m.52248 type:complete len:719 (+) Transcript_12392:273-2429(+)